LPASYHNKSCNLGFADGHVAIHTWLNHHTLQPVLKVNYDYTVTTDAQQDVVWFLQHASGPTGAFHGDWP
jgi:prepilin-type processing-associated H-X9-DG protein